MLWEGDCVGRRNHCARITSIALGRISDSMELALEQVLTCGCRRG